MARATTPLLPDDYLNGDKLHTERFVIARTDKGGQGGTVTFAISDKSIKLDGATTLMEGGEKLGIPMPFGCRMGICQSCVLPLESGYVRDLRSGTDSLEGRLMKAYRKPAIAGVHLEFADGINVFRLFPGNRIPRPRNDDARGKRRRAWEKPRVPACTPCSLRSTTTTKEYNHDEI